MDRCPPPAIRVAPKCRGGAQADITEVQFRFEIIAPPPELSSRINTFYVIETGEDRIEEIVPAYSAQLVAMVRGRLSLEHSPEAPQPAGSVVVNAPQMRSSPCLIEGPALLLGASLTQIG